MTIATEAEAIREWAHNVGYEDCLQRQTVDLLELWRKPRTRTPRNMTIIIMKNSTLLSGLR